jgi:hypothetical protein
MAGMDDFDLERRRREERRAVDEAGGGESEGFELAEEELIEHSSHGDEHSDFKIIADGARETPEDPAEETVEYGEPDEEIPPDL